MSTALTYRDAQAVDADRASNTAAAARLDRGYGSLTWMISAACIGVIGAVTAGLTGSEAATSNIAVIYLMLLAQMPWQFDEIDGGAQLRRVVGLSRRSVVSARYATLAGYVLILIVSNATARGVLLAAGFGDVAPAMFGVWAGATVAAAAGCIGIPARINWGRTACIVLLCIVVALALLAIMIIGSFAVSDYALRTPADAAVALGLLLLVAVGGGLASHRSAVRAYERKDL